MEITPSVLWLSLKNMTFQRFFTNSRNLIVSRRQQTHRREAEVVVQPHFFSFHFWDGDIFILMHHLCASRKQKKKKVGEEEMKLQNTSSCLDESVCV